MREHSSIGTIPTPTSTRAPGDRVQGMDKDTIFTLMAPSIRAPGSTTTKRALGSFPVMAIAMKDIGSKT